MKTSTKRHAAGTTAAAITFAIAALIGAAAADPPVDPGPPEVQHGVAKDNGNFRVEPPGNRRPRMTREQAQAALVRAGHFSTMISERPDLVKFGILTDRTRADRDANGELKPVVTERSVWVFIAENIPVPPLFGPYVPGAAETSGQYYGSAIVAVDDATGEYISAVIETEPVPRR